MAVTVTKISKSSPIALSNVTKASGLDIQQASPMGLLLALTYPATISGAGALTVNLISKS